MKCWIQCRDVERWNENQAHPYNETVQNKCKLTIFLELFRKLRCQANNYPEPGERGASAGCRDAACLCLGATSLTLGKLVRRFSWKFITNCYRLSVICCERWGPEDHRHRGLHTHFWAFPSGNPPAAHREDQAESHGAGWGQEPASCARNCPGPHSSLWTPQNRKIPPCFLHVMCIIPGTAGQMDFTAVIRLDPAVCTWPWSKATIQTGLTWSHHPSRAESFSVLRNSKHDLTF